MIQYKGISNRPSDILSEDGQATSLLNLIPRDGALIPYPIPSTILDLPAHQQVILIHNIGAIKNLIILDSSSQELLWLQCERDSANQPIAINPDATPTSIPADHQFTAPISVQAIGNTIIYADQSGLHYFLWREAGTYTFLGDHLPSLAFDLALSSKLIGDNEVHAVNIHNYDLNEPSGSFSDEHAAEISQPFKATINKFIADKVTSQGLFIYPFFVRYAYRLYDGTLTMHSAPVLLLASSAPVPAAVIQNTDPDVQMMKYKIYAFAHKILFGQSRQATFNPEQINELWSDIITSVDFFISPPIYTYDQNGNPTGWHTMRPGTILTPQFISQVNAPLSSQPFDINNYISALKTCGYHNIDTLTCVTIPQVNQATVDERIRTTSQFFHVASISLDKLPTETSAHKGLDIPGHILSSLQAQEPMTDDYQSHYRLLPSAMFAFNSRLALTPSQISLRPCYLPSSSISYINSGQQATITFWVFIHRGGKQIAIQSQSVMQIDGTNTLPPYWFFFPDLNARRLVIRIVPKANPSDTRWYDLPLTRHDFLNGAYYARSISNITIPPTPSDPIPECESISSNSETEAQVPASNLLYLSEVNNPFLFQATNITAVGSGTILGIAPATRALSQGQFGQYPLYVFTTDGIWAMSTSPDGTFAASFPVSRDVCSSAKGITQIDSAILFPTTRGILQISGGDCNSITELIDDDATFDIATLPDLPDLLRQTGLTLPPQIPMRTFTADAQIIYDYPNRRIYAFSPSSDQTLLLSLDSGQWSQLDIKIISTLNSYPDAFATIQTNDPSGNPINRLVNLSIPAGTPTSRPVLNGLYLSRPLKFGDATGNPLSLDSVTELINRGQHDPDNLNTLLFGSNDLRNWFLVAASNSGYIRYARSSPYRYHRIAIISRMTHGESLIGCNIALNPDRFGNRTRP